MAQDLAELSIVIPTLNAAETLPATLESIGNCGAELVVVDGGSADQTLTQAARLGARLIQARRGRGSQLAAGALCATRPWLLFLHADSNMNTGWQHAVRDFMDRPESRLRAGTFRFAIDVVGWRGRCLERYVAWRSRVFGLPYGDQGLLIARSFYESLGGFAEIPIMEDVDLVRRIGRRRLVQLETAITTSGDRYRRDGLLHRALRNTACHALWRIGVPPRVIARIYG